MSRDPRIDTYIERQADFARPILTHLREAVHAACPETEETLKWSMPTFMYKGQMLAGMAAFKAHATFGFWRGGLVVGEDREQMSAMGQFGRIASLDDLPRPAKLAEMVKKAMALTDAGVKAPRNKTVKEPFTVPDDLKGALAGNSAAAAAFEGFSPSAQRDYVEWITGAKREETRTKRLAQAVEWMAEGKRRNWKYENC
jgi:uncharacterized protein YdeI (YjbR/CyaY-like superfamily)